MNKILLGIIFLLINCQMVKVKIKEPTRKQTIKVEINNIIVGTSAYVAEEAIEKYQNLNMICPEDWDLIEIVFYREAPLYGICQIKPIQCNK